MSTIHVLTEKPVAYDSPDHIQPFGTANDNSINKRFNRKLLRLIPPAEIRLLDIGCSGGGFVKSILDAGGFAIGIEGSDFSQKRKRAEWATIPDNLFTADVTVPFKAVQQSSSTEAEVQIQFNVITAWEFFEHISQQGLPGVVDNILQHLAPNGLVIVSVAPYEDIENGVVLHQTVQPRAWWIAKFQELGLQYREEFMNYFTYDWVRGGPHRASFTLVLSRNNEQPLHIDRLRSLKLFYLPWESCRPFLRYLVGTLRNQWMSLETFLWVVGLLGVIFPVAAPQLAGSVLGGYLILSGMCFLGLAILKAAYLNRR